MELPAAIRNLIENRLQEGFSGDTCIGCNGSCCNGAGFAILENVLKIYEIYSQGGIERSDFDLEQGLSLRDFVYKYFDRVVFYDTLLCFYPKSISQNNSLISVPPWNFFEARKYIHKRVENCGCIFLSRKLDAKPENYCMLHDKLSKSHVTQKPIDCVFLTCNQNRKVIEPSNIESKLWFSLIDYHFPQSRDRFDKLCPNMPD